MQYYTLKIINIFRETADTVTISFKQPALKKIKYSAGQYLTLIFRINGRRYIRPYSFSSAPEIDTTLNVTVKRVPGGIVSNHIVDKLNIDDVVEVMEPMGDFTLVNKSISPDTHLVLWGAGSGITPLMSLAKYALNKNLVNHVTLVYGNRNFETVIFNQAIIELKKQYSNFSAWHFHAKLNISESNPNIIEGRIDPDKVLSIMQQEGRLENTVHYICGPTGLKESVKNALKVLGINSERIFSEDFEIIRDPAEFEHITTRMVAFVKDGQTIVAEVIKGKSILEGGLDAMIELSYSCQTGNCLVCKGKLLQGEVKTLGVKKLPEGLSEDERLLCCSFPLTDNVEIAIL